MMSVLFSTHNGGTVLPKMLASLARAKIPVGGCKFIAVNNASTDDTQRVLEDFSQVLKLTVLQEPAPGKNRSLNRALEHAEGDLFIFCDDDVIVAEDWLLQWRALADGLPEYLLFAGSTLPFWPADPPEWSLKTRDISIIFGTNEHMMEGPCDPRCMLGTNMALRAAIFEDGSIKFDAKIGPDSSRAYPMGSETQLARRLANLGYECWFSPGPRVAHIIRPHQLERPAILMRAYRWGRGQAHMEEPHHYSPQRLSRKNFLRWSLYPLLMHFYGPAEAWSRQWEWVADQGYEDGWRERQEKQPRWLSRQGGPRIVSRFR